MLPSRLFRTPRRGATGPLADDDASQVYVTMETGNATPSGTRARRPFSFGRSVAGLRTRLSRLLRPRRAGGAGDDAAAERARWESERTRWASERAMILEECTSARAEANRLSQTLDGWAALVRDALFYGGLHGRAASLTSIFADRLRASVAEVEGVTEIEITELRLPQSPEIAPELTLIKYCGPELSEWRLRWSPPASQAHSLTHRPAVPSRLTRVAPSQAGGAITLRGRKFGVTFTLVVTVSAVKIDGRLQCCCCVGDGVAQHEPPTARVGFKHLPEISFEMSLQGKALSLGSDFVRALLQLQIERGLRAQAPRISAASRPPSAARCPPRPADLARRSSYPRRSHSSCPRAWAAQRADERLTPTPRCRYRPNTSAICIPAMH